MTLQQVEDAIDRSNANVGGDILTLGSQAHNVRAIGLLGGGVDPLDPANVERAAAIEAEKLEDIQRRRRHLARAARRSTSGRSPRSIVGHRPRLGIVGRRPTRTTSSRASS